MPVRRPAIPLIALAFTGCGGGLTTVSVDDYNTKTVTLPGGQIIRAEVMMRPADMQRGMKYRDSLAPGRGMLFLHGSTGAHAYWMHEVRIPLDMIWMNESKTIVEIYRNAEPCAGPAEKCPVYGGRQNSMYVLELAGGMIDRYALKLGQTLTF